MHHYIPQPCLLLHYLEQLYGCLLVSTKIKNYILFILHKFEKHISWLSFKEFSSASFVEVVATLLIFLLICKFLLYCIIWKKTNEICIFPYNVPDARFCHIPLFENQWTPWFKMIKTQNVTIFMFIFFYLSILSIVLLIFRPWAVWK